MSAGYGPVVTKRHDDDDGLIRGEDEWGVRYEGHRKPGGGTFHYRKRPSRRKYLFIGAGVIVVLVIIVIIAVAVQKHTDEHHAKQNPLAGVTIGHWQNRSREGLMFFPKPEDETVLIKYISEREYQNGGYGEYVNSLDHALYDYKGSQQLGKEFIHCNSTYTNSSKVCKFDLAALGPCHNIQEYGFASGTPCVLLQLHVPVDKQITLFPNTSKQSLDLGERYAPGYIGVSCDGETDKDKAHINRQAMNRHPIEYFPPNGFPVYYFHDRTIDQHLDPLVMVRFNGIHDQVAVTIRCTAWAQSFNNGHPETSDLYSTSFIILHTV